LTNNSQLIAASKKSDGSPVKAILFGFILDIIGSFVVMFVVLIGYSVFKVLRGGGYDEIILSLQNIKPDSMLSLVTNFFSCLVSILSGYVCSKIANNSEYKYVFILGCLISIFGWTTSVRYYSILENIFFTCLTFGNVYLGGWLYVRKKGKMVCAPNKQINRNKQGPLF